MTEVAWKVCKQATMEPTDEQSAADAERAGGRFRVTDRPKLWACEPARWRSGNVLETSTWWWAEPCGLLASQPNPWCEICWEMVRWRGRPTKKDGEFVYPVECRCGPDEIRSVFPLQMGGTAEWWLEVWGVNV